MSDSNHMLILAVTRMRAGVCVAGMSRTADPITGLRWVRPVKPHAPLLLGDIRYPDGALMHVGDVVDWVMGPPRVEPPHVEDVLFDPVRHRPQFVRRLDSARRAQFCAEHIDTRPDDVLRYETRSLCIVRPDSLAALWALDAYSGHYEARMHFRAGGFATEGRGIPVTDLAWRAIGRAWLRGQARVDLDDAALRAQVGEVFLVIGRGRAFEGRYWPLVVGVHAAGMPEVEIDEMAL